MATVTTTTKGLAIKSPEGLFAQDDGGTPEEWGPLETAFIRDAEFEVLDQRWLDALGNGDRLVGVTLTTTITEDDPPQG